MKIAILDDYQNAVKDLHCFGLLKGHEVKIITRCIRDPNWIAENLKDIDIIVLIRERTRIDEMFLSNLPNLVMICQTGKVSNHIDIKSCTRNGIAIAEGVGSPIAPAELTWALIMNSVRCIPQAIDGLKKGNWQTNIGSVIDGQTIGIWGYGKIGRKIANYSKVFGANVIIWGSELSRLNALNDGFAVVEGKNDFFSKADILSLHLRLTNETFEIVKEEDLKLMKPTSILVNTSRAELIQRGALIKCLKNGRPGFACIDVYENEPIFNNEYELFNLPNALCTPHIGYVERKSYELYFGKAFENIINFINGTPTNIINQIKK